MLMSVYEGIGLSLFLERQDTTLGILAGTCGMGNDIIRKDKFP